MAGYMLADKVGFIANKVAFGLVSFPPETPFYSKPDLDQLCLIERGLLSWRAGMNEGRLSFAFRPGRIGRKKGIEWPLFRCVCARGEP